MEVTDDNIWEILGLHRGDDEFSGDYFEAGDILKEGAHPPPTEASGAPAVVSSPQIGRVDLNREDETVTLVEAELAKAQSLLSRVFRDRRGRSPDSMGQRNETAAVTVQEGAPDLLRTSVSDERRKEILAHLAIERSEKRGFASSREKMHLESMAATKQKMGDTAAATAPIAAPAPHTFEAMLDTALSRNPVYTALAATAPVGEPPVTAINDAVSSRAPSALQSVSASIQVERRLQAEEHSAAASSVRTGHLDKEALVSRLLAERQARKAVNSEPPLVSAGWSSLPGVLTSTLALSASNTQAETARRPATAADPLPLKVVSSAGVHAGVDRTCVETDKPPTPELLKKLRAEAAARMSAKLALTSSPVAPRMVSSPAQRLPAHLAGSAVPPAGTSPATPGDSDTTPAKSVSPEGSLPANWSGNGKLFHRRSRADIERAVKEKADKDCTFQPAIGTKAASTAGSHRQFHVTNAQRLAMLAQNKKRVYEQRDAAKREKEAAEISLCTFQPRSSKSPVPAPRAPPIAAAPNMDAKPAPQTVEPRSEAGAHVSEFLADSLSWSSSLAKRHAKSSSNTNEPRWISSTVVPQREPAKPGPAPPSSSAALPPSATTQAPAPPRKTIAAVNRLYEEAERRMISRARAKAEIERKSLAECTFQPSISKMSEQIVEHVDLLPSTRVAATLGIAASHAAARKPIFERVDEIQRAKAQKLARLRMESELADPDLTFQPKISAASQQIASARLQQAGLPIAASSSQPTLTEEGRDNLLSSSLPSTAGTERGRHSASIGPPHAFKSSMATATDRLARDATEAQARKAARAQIAARTEAAKFTFAPIVSQEASRLVLHKLAALGVDEQTAKSMSFVDRQRLLEEHHRYHQQIAAAELEKAKGYTFKPEIGNAEIILAHARPELVMESDTQRYHRLAVGDLEQRLSARAAVQKDVMAQLTFKPEINAASRAYGRAHTVEEHVRNEEGKRARLRAAALAEADFRSKHTFQPHLVASESIGAHDDSDGPLRLRVASDPTHVSERIEEHMKAREAKLEAARRIREYEELRECTFQPEVNKSETAHSSEVVVVRGLGRFLELKELSKKIAEDKQEREEGAFAVRGLPASYDIPGLPRPPTIPEPFHLTVDHRAAGKAEPAVGALGFDETRPSVSEEAKMSARSSQRPAAALGAKRKMITDLLEM